MGDMDTLIGEAFGEVFGGGLVMGAALFLFFVYVMFKCQVPTSGIVFMGIFGLGVLTYLGYLAPIWYGIVLAVGAFYFWRSAVAVGG